MDLESFTQCLNYISTTAKPASQFNQAIDKALPVATTIVGILIGFVLNISRERSKEKKTIKDKKQCISEEVERIKISSKLCYKQALFILGVNMEGKFARGHSMPPRVEPVLTNEYFKTIAHSYKPSTRENILHLLDLAAALTERVAIARTQAESVQKEFDSAHNVLTHSAFCYAICEAILEDREPDYSNLYAIADKYEFESPFLDKYRTSTPTKNSTYK